jgi:hypothetical protein
MKGVPEGELTKGLEEIIFEEIPLRVSGMYAPPVVSEHVEDGKHDDEEGASPFSLKADGNEDTRRETEDRNDDAGEAPLTLKDKPDKEENEKHASCELEAAWQV